MAEQRESQPVVVAANAQGVATLTIHSKTMTPEFFEAFEAAMVALEDNLAVRAVVIRAEDAKAFSYGLDLPKAFAKWGNIFQGGLVTERKKLHRVIKQLQRPLDLLFSLRVPTIAALHGHCIGGGLDLAAACDLRLAASNLNLSLRETRIAIVADLGSLQRLPSIIGQGRTRELAFTGRDVSAAEALQMGLVNSVHTDKAALDAAAQALAVEIAANAPRTVEGVKVVLNRAIEAEIRDGLDHVAAWNTAFLPSEDLGEAVAAFATRRAPQWKGR